MRGWLLIVVGVWLASGCDSSSSSKPHPALATDSCFADEIGALERGWKRWPECGTDNAVCSEACRAGDAHACFSRAIEIQGAEGSEQEILELFKRTCTHGLATGCTNWAATAWTEKHMEWRCLFRVFQKSCDAGEPFSCGMKGRLLIEEGKSAADLVLGRVWLEHACALYAGTCHLLAIYLEDGTFAAADPLRAKALTQRACDAGDPSACDELKGEH